MRIVKSLIALVLVLLCATLGGCNVKAKEEVAQTIDNMVRYGVSLASYGEIQDINLKLSQLTNRQKASLRNIDEFEDFVQEYQKLEDEKVSEIEALIDAIDIDHLKIASEDEIKEVQKTYDRLNYQVQDRISNYSHLEDAFQKIEDLKEEAWVECDTCGGSGYVRCSLCNGSGSRWVKHQTPNGKWWDVTQDCKTTQCCGVCSGLGGIYVE